jgi:hypothetical protein
MRWIGRRLAALDRHPAGHRLILRVLPRAIARRFDPSGADDLEATLELTIRDPRGRPPARFGLAIAGGRCAVSPGSPERPAARATMASRDLILLATRATTWPALFSDGRFELSGDPFLALRFATLFRLPVGLPPVSPSASR